MLSIRDISFSMEGRPLFEGASAQIPTGKIVGVVGRNGTGKTTLFRMIRGELPLDGGEIETPRRTRIGGVAQEAPASDDSLLDTVLAADEERAALLAEAETAADPHRIADIQTRLVDIDAHSAEARASAILNGLGFDADAQKQACAEFSGGWRMRVALAAVLFSRPDLLLLDEPTNYLDLEGAMWLENFLARYPATALVISHDRDLLNRAVGGILHLHNRKLTFYTGGYDDFDKLRREKLANQASAAKKQEAVRAHLQSFVDRFRAKATKAKQAQARLKMLSRMEPIAAEIEGGVAPFQFETPKELAPPILSLEDVSVGYGGKPVLSNLSLRIDQDDRIALLGANGEGKSTFAKLISDRLAPMDGDLRAASKLKIGFFAQHQLDELTRGETPIDHIRRLRPELPPAKLRALLGAGGLGADAAESPVENLSGGQKARLLMRLATLDAPQMIILDEPTNHLDIESREALIRGLSDYEGAVILISHDPHLVEAVADRLWLVKDGAVKPFDGDMEDYRTLLISERSGGGNGGGRAAKQAKNAKKSQRRNAASIRKEVAPLRAELKTAEDRVAKLEEMREKIDSRLADPDLYEKGPAEIARLQRKRAEIIAGLERAETMWLEAEERLEAAKMAE